MTVAPLSRPMTFEDTIWPNVRVDGDLERARIEWLHTNGAGAYASSTVAQMHTRRYHGLLVAALDPPRKRHVIVSHMDVSLEASSQRYDLETHQFPNVEPTAGYKYLTRFDQSPLPRWIWQLPSGTLEHTMALVRGQNAAVFRYAWRGPGTALLRVRPLLALRPFHALVREHGSMVQSVELRHAEVRVRPVPSLPRVVFGHSATFIGSPDWWRRFEYLAEQERGLDFHEDLWTPGMFSLDLLPNVAAFLVVALDALPDKAPAELMREAEDALSAHDPGPLQSRAGRVLSAARQAFIADQTKEPAIIAGYPWFEVWGRDTLISLPGLVLVHREADVAREVLRTMVRHMQDGLVPHRLPDEGKATEFHAADATLWLFEAARLFVELVGDSDEFVQGELFDALVGAFESALRGTRHNIHVTEEGLFAAADAGFALTWMDAKVGDWAVTPRAGLPIELQALWARACDTIANLATALGRAELAVRAKDAHARCLFSFRRRFWCDVTGYPYDVVSESPGETAWSDASIRPNAVIALAVEPRLFDASQAHAILALAEKHLVTPAGLRTLAPVCAGYAGHYGGGVKDRDSAYHQGTVWPFLTGFYVRAAMRQRGRDPKVRQALEGLVESALANALALGQVPEVADAEPPHRPGGCVAQAWSVAELLRALAWDLA
jgi:predicted glycogen debranching enzyme